jgi:hypothetical protein
MSYLNALRMHFAGRFQANVSTVNNDPGHYDNATFIPSYQDMQGPRFNPPNGWFNPQGDAAWRLLGCTVTSAWIDGAAAGSSDPVLKCIVADSDSKAPGKLVDLDPEQQLVSEIWGLQVRIADANGHTLLQGDYEPAAFSDIWDRAIGASAGGDVDAGAAYQSVLTNLQWGDVSKSKFLTKLKEAAADGLLSIKFNLDGVNLSFNSPDFMSGRIAGTIGPATASEPHHMVLGRQFMASHGSGGNFFSPLGGINFFPAVVDEGRGAILLDLGNALSTTVPGGPMTDLGDLTLGIYEPPSPGNPSGSVTALAKIPSQGKGGYASKDDPDWYSRTAGVVSVRLRSAQLKAIAAAPLVLTSGPSTFISEWTSGVFVRADRYVYRMSPGDQAEVPVYVTQWGRPAVKANVGFYADPSQLQPSNNIAPNDVPPVAVPPGAMSFNATARTDAGGKAILTLKATDPGTPRYFNNGKDYGLDGQVYGIRPTLPGVPFAGPVNQWNFVSILVWSGFKTSKPVTWNDLQPIFQQYANLYPVMNRFLNLADYDSVVRHAGLLTLAFGLDPADPNAMPVTRDLSPAKRDAILSWLKKPIRGPVKKAKIAQEAPEAERTVDPAAAILAAKGGKAAAAARRVVVQRQRQS